jgi:hypothetical protein
VDVDGLCSATFFNAQALPSAARRFLLQIEEADLERYLRIPHLRE